MHFFSGLVPLTHGAPKGCKTFRSDPANIFPPLLFHPSYSRVPVMRGLKCPGHMGAVRRTGPKTRSGQGNAKKETIFLFDPGAPNFFFSGSQWAGKFITVVDSGIQRNAPRAGKPHAASPPREKSRKGKRSEGGTVNECMWDDWWEIVLPMIYELTIKTPKGKSPMVTGGSNFPPSIEGIAAGQKKQRAARRFHDKRHVVAVPACLPSYGHACTKIKCWAMGPAGHQRTRIPWRGKGHWPAAAPRGHFSKFAPCGAAVAWLCSDTKPPRFFLCFRQESFSPSHQATFLAPTAKP